MADRGPPIWCTGEVTTTRRRWPLAAGPAALALALTLSACAAPADDAAPAADPAPAAGPASAGPTSSAPVPASASTEASTAGEPSTTAEKSTAAAAPGRYVDLAAYRADKAAFHDGDVVLFFNASWCPTCQEATRNLTDDPKALGPGLTVVSVDYDENTDLRQEYGITYQHTFVLVDADGAELKKWSGSSTPQEIADKVG